MELRGQLSFFPLYRAWDGESLAVAMKKNAGVLFIYPFSFSFFISFSFFFLFPPLALGLFFLLA